MSDSIILIAKITARAEAAEDVAKILNRLADASRKEKGCTRYAVVQDLVAPQVFSLVEEWESAAALDLHNTMPHVHEALAKAGPLLAKNLELGRYRILS